MNRVYYVAGIPYGNNELYHFGIKGQKWGIRRYQNEDGTLTQQGKIRYSDKSARKELGFEKKRGLGLDKYAENYMTYMYKNSRNKEEKYKEKAAKNIGKKNYDKYVAEGKEYSKSAQLYKAFAETYNNIPQHNKKELNRLLDATFSATGLGYKDLSPTINRSMYAYLYGYYITQLSMRDSLGN